MNNAIRSQYVLIRNKWRNDFTLKSVAEVLLCPRQNIQSNQVKYGKTFSSLRKMNNRSFHLSVKNFSDKVHSTKSESEDNIDSSSLETQKEDELKVDVGYKLGEENNDTVDDNENIENIDISKFTHKIETKMPDLDVDGKIVQWFKEKGDIIHKGDLLCDVETEVRQSIHDLV